MRPIFFPAQLDGCALWRFFLPHLKIPGSMFVYDPYLFVPDGKDIKAAAIQRAVSVESIVAIRAMKAKGLKVVYDLDDNLWQLPPHNPARQQFSLVKNFLPMCIMECNAMVVSTEPLRAAVI